MPEDTEEACSQSEAIGEGRMSMTEYGIRELKRRVKENKVLTFEERKYINKALEEIQQYRALEQKLQSVYGEHDGLLEIIVNGLLRYENAPDKAIKCVLLTDDDVDTWEQLKAIGTIDEFKALKEKNEPKKPIHHGLREDKVICPHCNKWLEAHSSKVFCCWCGRKIDWSE